MALAEAPRVLERGREIAATAPQGDAELREQRGEARDLLATITQSDLTI